MSVPSECERENEDPKDEMDMLLDSFLSPAPVKILRELAKQGGRVNKSEFMDSKDGQIRWATYVRYEEAFIRSGLVAIEKENSFPFKQYIVLTEKGRKVVGLIEEIQNLVISEYDQKPQVH